jgi:hypothetical protein
MTLINFNKLIRDIKGITIELKDKDLGYITIWTRN